MALADSSKTKIKALVNDVLLKIIKVLNRNLNLGLLTTHQCPFHYFLILGDISHIYISEQ